MTLRLHTSTRKYYYLMPVFTNRWLIAVFMILLYFVFHMLRTSMFDFGIHFILGSRGFFSVTKKQTKWKFLAP